MSSAAGPPSSSMPDKDEEEVGRVSSGQNLKQTERSQDRPIVYATQKWTVIDKKKIDSFAIKLQAEGGINMRSWNKVMGEQQLLPNMEIQREAFRLYQNL